MKEKNLLILLIAIMVLGFIFITEYKNGNEIEEECIELGYNESRNIYCYKKVNNEDCFMKVYNNISAKYWCNLSYVIISKEGEVIKR